MGWDWGQLEPPFSPSWDLKEDFCFGYDTAAMGSSYAPAFPWLGIFPRERNTQVVVQNSPVHHSSKKKTTHSHVRETPGYLYI